MDSSQMQGLVDSHMTAENHGDMDGAVAVYTEDVEQTSSDSPTAPVAVRTRRAISTPTSPPTSAARAGMSCASISQTTRWSSSSS